jgi:hypothetical protein
MYAEVTTALLVGSAEAGPVHLAAALESLRRSQALYLGVAGCI